jgi:hypothetical protein
VGGGSRKRRRRSRRSNAARRPKSDEKAVEVAETIQPLRRRPFETACTQDVGSCVQAVFFDPFPLFGKVRKPDVGERGATNWSQI